MIEEIEDLHALADECRWWLCEGNASDLSPAVRAEFKRVAAKLDAIAKRLAERAHD